MEKAKLDAKNIVLIGMPNSGKSSSGRAISRQLDIRFMDTDILITKTMGMKPAQIVAKSGRGEFLRLQEEILLNMKISGSVISTGGSVIYSDKVMFRLKENGKVFFLDEELATLLERITEERRFADDGQKSFEQLYEDRLPVYKKYADFTIDCRNKETEEIAVEVIKIFTVKG